jgi:hypothetical protein
MSVTGAARGTSQRRLFYRCGASIYRGRGRLGAVRSVCRTAGLGVGRAIVCSHPGRVLLHGGVARSIVGAPPRCEAKANQYTEPALFAPGAGAPCMLRRDQLIRLLTSYRGGRMLLEAAWTDLVCRVAPRLITNLEEYPEAGLARLRMTRSRRHQVRGRGTGNYCDRKSAEGELT